MAHIWQYPPEVGRGLIWFDLLIYFCHKIYWKYIYRTSKVAECGRQRSKVKTLLLHDQRRALLKFHVTDSQNTRDQITRDRRSKRVWLKCVLCINTCPNECWLHTYDPCAITTWRLGLRAPLVARKKMVSRKPELEAWGLYGVQGPPRLV